MNRPPHRPPSELHILPSSSQNSRGVREAGISPTRKSAARDGHRVWREFGASGLTSSCSLGDRYPEMTKSPGQRNPWVENRRAASSSIATRKPARVVSRVHRLDRLQASEPTRLDLGILAESRWKDPQNDLALEGSSGARRADEHQLECPTDRQSATQLGVWPVGAVQ